MKMKDNSNPFHVYFVHIWFGLRLRGFELREKYAEKKVHDSPAE